ncbi:MAG TPA: hypothetical protein VGP63_13385 [Planctomycetaceae bacterium]|nr:hypothetical protein [Planctomycetaceae bacterium]
MIYAELRAQSARAYCRQNAALFGLVPTWGPLWNCAGQMSGGDPQSLFNQIHDASIRAIAAQQTSVDWTQTYALVKPLLDAQPLVAAIDTARGDLTASETVHGESQTLTKELLARHIRDAFARAGLQHLTRIRFHASQKTAIDPSTLLATIITAVLGVVCPPTAAFAAILEPIIAAVIKVLFSSLTTQFTSGTFGASPDAFNAQIQRWAQEASES